MNWPKKKPWGKLFLFSIIVCAIMIMRNQDLKALLNHENLSLWIEGHGLLAPAIYMLIYSLAPVFFLPGLPLTIIGGVLFGSFWGVIYAITGATSGACLAFLISRYLARDWIESRLTSDKWKKLDDEVQSKGWKVVAVTRLIPLFPFNLLNYAFGLTKIGFLPYAVTTFFCMLPACIAFIVFSSSLMDLLKGKISIELIAGIGLICLVSILPVLYRKFKRGRKKK